MKFIMGAIFGSLFISHLVYATNSAKVDQALLDKGKRLYKANCLSCHNQDPNIKGSIGPEITDAPLEVMKVKIVTGRYPEKLPVGFTPKRKTKLMKKFPQLEKDIPAIHAWVQSVKKKK